MAEPVIFRGLGLPYSPGRARLPPLGGNPSPGLLLAHPSARAHLLHTLACACIPPARALPHCQAPAPPIAPRDARDCHIFALRCDSVHLPPLLALTPWPHDRAHILGRGNDKTKAGGRCLLFLSRFPAPNLRIFNGRASAMARMRRSHAAEPCGCWACTLDDIYSATHVCCWLHWLRVYALVKQSPIKCSVEGYTDRPAPITSGHIGRQLSDAGCAWEDGTFTPAVHERQQSSAMRRCLHRKHPAPCHAFHPAAHGARDGTTET